MKRSCTYHAHAKINLLLDVTGRLPSGYHSVAMLMQSISLHDTITVEATGGRGIEITCDVPGIPTDGRNIAHKASKAFGIDSGLRVTIEKRIPSEAGLAGGSANAAAVLTALRDMYAPEMPDEDLRDIGLYVGADVPFCLAGGCCLAQGVGELLTPLPSLPESYAVALAKPAFSVSTARAYAALDSIEIQRPRTELVISLAKQGDWERALALCANVFEQAIDVPGLARAKRQAVRSGALLTQMTGSGSAVFSMYRDDADADGIAAALAMIDEDVRVYRPVAYGVYRAE